LPKGFQVGQKNDQAMLVKNKVSQNGHILKVCL